MDKSFPSPVLRPWYPNFLVTFDVTVTVLVELSSRALVDFYCMWYHYGCSTSDPGISTAIDSSIVVANLYFYSHLPLISLSSQQSLKKPVVPVIVGSGYEWQGTVVGLLVSSQEVQPINLQDVSSDEEYRSKIEDIK